jgi:hypothetical protein
MLIYVYILQAQTLGRPMISVTRLHGKLSGSACNPEIIHAMNDNHSRHESSVGAGNYDGFAERLQIFLLADRMHRPQFRQQVVNQRTQPRPWRAVRE